MLSVVKAKESGSLKPRESDDFTVYTSRKRVQRGNRVQYNWRLVVAVVLREGSPLCLTSLEPAMEPDSLWRENRSSQRSRTKPNRTRVETSLRSELASIKESFLARLGARMRNL